ncbi:hypothetical protein [Chitinophaga vietnamensis]|uniref:hypothetical protein n=1 Tax=Chitinophaga vietnamensis TaxID=2593957 RepID=UPI001177F3B9|nr:hypothetical protein [Chitinophaga vietnamensis]
MFKFLFKAFRFESNDKDLFPIGEDVRPFINSSNNRHALSHKNKHYYSGMRKRKSHHIGLM